MEDRNVNDCEVSNEVSEDVAIDRPLVPGLGFAHDVSAGFILSEIQLNLQF